MLLHSSPQARYAKSARALYHIVPNIVRYIAPNIVRYIATEHSEVISHSLVNIFHK